MGGRGRHDRLRAGRDRVAAARRRAAMGVRGPCAAVTLGAVDGLARVPLDRGPPSPPAGRDGRLFAATGRARQAVRPARIVLPLPSSPYAFRPRSAAIDRTFAFPAACVDAAFKVGVLPRTIHSEGIAIPVPPWNAPKQGFTSQEFAYTDSGIRLASQSGFLAESFCRHTRNCLPVIASEFFQDSFRSIPMSCDLQSNRLVGVICQSTQQLWSQLPLHRYRESNLLARISREGGKDLEWNGLVASNPHTRIGVPLDKF